MNTYLKGNGDFEPDYTKVDALDDYLNKRQQELMQAGKSADEAWRQALEDAAATEEF